HRAKFHKSHWFSSFAAANFFPRIFASPPAAGPGAPTARHPFFRVYPVSPATFDTRCQVIISYSLFYSDMGREQPVSQRIASLWAYIVGMVISIQAVERLYVRPLADTVKVRLRLAVDSSLKAWCDSFGNHAACHADRSMHKHRLVHWDCSW